MSHLPVRLGLMLSLLLPGMAWADPLGSPGWGWMVTRYFESAPVVFSDRVRVTAPRGAEDAMSVPVGVDASVLGAEQAIEEILVFADLNPITTILRYYPEPGTPPRIAFRFKIQQASPVRAAVRTADGTWHVAGQWIDAAGGGCTEPSVASGSGLWADRLGEIALQWLPRENGLGRLRTRIIHPMDTGLAGSIPAFYIEETVYDDAAGKRLARLETFEPVSENPIISVDLPAQAVVIRARDGAGNRFTARTDG